MIRPLSSALDETLARLRRAVAAREKADAERAARVAAWRESPEGRAELRRREEAANARAREGLVAACKARGVPEHPRILAAVLAARPLPMPALHAIEDAERWAHDGAVEGFPLPVTLVLAGRPGNGKTTAMARRVARCEEGGLYIRARTIGSTPDNDWSENRALRERLAAVRFLAIDEAGLEESEKAGPRVAALLSERHDGGRFTVLATNLGEEAFVARYFDDRSGAVSDRLRSRLNCDQGRNGAPDGLGWWVELPDCDLRDPDVYAAVARECAEDAA